MSAFIVSHDHIDALMTFATKRDNYGTVSYYVPQTMSNKPGGTRVDITTQNATEIGRILLTENERSIYARYPDCRPGGNNNPGTIGEDAANYHYRPWSRIPDPVAILKGCSCFDYQSCESGDYDGTLAWIIINAIRDRAIHRLPGYDDAPGWEFDRNARPSQMRKVG